MYKNRKEEKKGRQYIHDQVVRHVWISGTCTRILSSFSALPVLCCCDYSFAVCRRRARINSTPLFHFAHFSPLIDIRQGSEKEKIGDLVYVGEKKFFRVRHFFPSHFFWSLHTFSTLLSLSPVSWLLGGRRPATRRNRRAIESSVL
jgi:hypothetical protein